MAETGSTRGALRAFQGSELTGGRRLTASANEDPIAIDLHVVRSYRLRRRRTHDLAVTKPEYAPMSWARHGLHRARDFDDTSIEPSALVGALVPNCEELLTGPEEEQGITIKFSTMWLAFDEVIKGCHIDPVALVRLSHRLIIVHSLGVKCS